MNFIDNFFSSLEASDIKYVHWKSNKNIELALAGVDDLDILVDPACEDKLQAVFKELNIIRAFSDKDRWQKGITHYIGLDIYSKQLVHIHLHYQLSLGYDFDKCFSLPVVNEYLNNRTNYRGKVFLPSYENEYCVLVIRLILKNALTPFLLLLPNQQYLVFRNAKSKGVVRGSGYTEFIDLKSKIDPKKLEHCLANNFSYLNKDVFAECESALVNNSNVRAFFKAGRKLKHQLKTYRQYGELTSFRKAFARLYAIRFFSILGRLHIYNKIHGKKAENGGRIIAFIGGDGAGKTTTIANLRNTLKKQFAVASIHVGKPKMTVNGLFFRILSKALSLVTLKDMSEAFFLLSIAVNRKKAFFRARKLRNRGVIVLQDRIPLKGITAMDCPRTHTIANGKYKRIIKLEQKIYAAIKGVDMLFVMKLDPQMALIRRPDDNKESLLNRSGQIWTNQWDAPYAHEINTGENDQDQVQDILLDKVWKNFNLQFVKAEIMGLNGTGKTSLFDLVNGDYPNTYQNIRIKDYPAMLIKGILLHSFSTVAVWIKTKNFKIALLSLHFYTSLDMLRYWYKTNKFPFCNLILDQGPLFQSSLLFKEKCISEQEFSNLLMEINSYIPIVFLLTAPKEILYRRVSNRNKADLGGRGHHLNFEDFCDFCTAYNKSFEIVKKRYSAYIQIDTNMNSLDNVFGLLKKKIDEEQNVAKGQI